ncbi:MAG: type II secretion system F family protein [Elusimicrobiota bacterium]
MPTFTYKGKMPSGAPAQGTIDAPQLRAALDKLRLQKLQIAEITEIPQNPVLLYLKKINPFGPSVGGADLVIFTRQLSTLISSGVPLVQGLTILSEQMENKFFQNIVADVKSNIEAGQSIFEAMSKHPEAYSELYVSMVKAGEMGGVLDVILDRLAGYLEASEELKHKVKGAMMYPIVVLTIAMGVTVFLLIAIIPKFKDIFTSFGSELPKPTQALLTLSAVCTHYWYMFIITPIAFIKGLSAAKKNPAFAYKYDQWALKSPMFGIILRKVAIAKFSRTMATLIKSGVNIMDALETVGKTSGNKVIEEAVMACRKSIQEGQRLVEPLKKSKVFPPMVTQMIAIGEESGNLDNMLNKIADFYDSEVDNAVKGLTSMIEPLVICFMGIVIGGMVVAMFLPMFEISQKAGDM